MMMLRFTDVFVAPQIAKAFGRSSARGNVSTTFVVPAWHDSLEALRQIEQPRLQSLFHLWSYR